MTYRNEPSSHLPAPDRRIVRATLSPTRSSLKGSLEELSRYLTLTKKEEQESIVRARQQAARRVRAVKRKAYARARLAADRGASMELAAKSLELEAQYQEKIRLLEQQAFEFGVKAAEKILRKELAADPSFLIRELHASLLRISDSSSYTVLASPAHADKIRQAFERSGFQGSVVADSSFSDHTIELRSRVGCFQVDAVHYLEQLIIQIKGVMI